MLKVKRVLDCLYRIREYGIEVSGKCPGRLLLKKPNKLLFWCGPVLVQTYLSPRASCWKGALADRASPTEQTLLLYQQKGFSFGHCNLELLT